MPIVGRPARDGVDLLGQERIIVSLIHADRSTQHYQQTGCHRVEAAEALQPDLAQAHRACPPGDSRAEAAEILKRHMRQHQRRRHGITSFGQADSILGALRPMEYRAARPSQSTWQFRPAKLPLDGPEPARGGADPRGDHPK
jgi:hypothetical protein